MNNIKYSLEFLQQPKRCKVSHLSQIGPTQEIRPIDPPPILKLSTKKNSDDKFYNDLILSSPAASDEQMSMLELQHVFRSLQNNPPFPLETFKNTFFVNCVILSYDVSNKKPILESFDKNQSNSVLVGSTLVGGTYVKVPKEHSKIRDQAICFVFNNLRVAKIGEYILCFSLYERIGIDLVKCHGTFSSNPFVVRSARTFEGRKPNTVLTRYFILHGTCIRNRGTKKFKEKEIDKPVSVSAIKLIPIKKKSTISTNKSSSTAETKNLYYHNNPALSYFGNSQEYTNAKNIVMNNTMIKSPSFINFEKDIYCQKPIFCPKPFHPHEQANISKITKISRPPGARKLIRYCSQPMMINRFRPFRDNNQRPQFTNPFEENDKLISEPLPEFDIKKFTAQKNRIKLPGLVELGLLPPESNYHWV